MFFFGIASVISKHANTKCKDEYAALEKHPKNYNLVSDDRHHIYQGRVLVSPPQQTDKCLWTWLMSSWNYISQTSNQAFKTLKSSPMLLLYQFSDHTQ